MNRRISWFQSMRTAGFAALAAAFLVGMAACQQGPVAVDNDDIGGVVTSAEGPEAGVWVIAETTDLPTKFVRIVVTDDQGQYLVPDLPAANYNVWVRGYGLVDSAKVQAAPGSALDLTATVAPSQAAAAQYYPAIYWYSMLQVPAKSEFPGTGPNGNGFHPDIESQAELLHLIKTDSCASCHGIGDKATREFPEGLGEFESSVAAWERRIQSGQAGPNMIRAFSQIGLQGATKMFADWTDRVAGGELPFATPPRPQGVERNVVITQWDWADPKAYLHDETATDQRDPRVNANGKIYGAMELAADYSPVVDPVTHTASRVPLQVRDEDTPSPVDDPIPAPSPYWGTEPIWTSKANAHNPMMDQDGRVWYTARIRAPGNPDFCKQGSDHPSAKLFPMERSGARHLSVYDPKTDEYKMVDTCFGNHHLYFAEDENNTLWTSAGGPNNPVIGWLNTKMFLETGDSAASQGWAPPILDTNGNGKQDAWVEPDQPVDPTKDKRVLAGYYGVAPSVKDGSVWGSSLGFPGSVLRFDPATNLAEYYELPYGNPAASIQGYSPRGMFIDRQGVVWASLASGHVGAFDRTKCTGPLNGPKATGQHCPEGWTLYPLPGPQFKGLTESGSAEASYWTWVDQFDVFGLGADTPIATGNLNEALLALKDGQFITLRVPYPMGFFAKGMDARIDDPDAGWKGKGLWATWSTRTMTHAEGGKGTTSKVVKFQLRPDPLAK